MRTTGLDFATIDLVAVSKDSIINKVANSKVNRAKVDDKMAKSKSQYKNKDENLTKVFVQSFGSSFLTFGAKQAFTKMKQTYIETPILYHFDSNSYILIETNISHYAIDGILSQVSLDNLGQ